MFKLTLALIFSVSLCLAADRIPKEMKPKLIRDGKVLIDEKFDGSALSAEWKKPAGDNAGTVVLKEGICEIDSGTGRQGAIWRKLDDGVTDATVQVLMKPFAVNWMGVRFMTESDEGDRSWKIAVAIYSTGFVRAITPDGAKLKVLKSAKVKAGQNDWWRVCVESKDDKYLVRVNGEEAFELKADETTGPKKAVLVNLYGGKGAVDEVQVTAAK